MNDTPLGKEVSYSSHYSPSLLVPVARSETRHSIGLHDDLPFTGIDIWNAWELTWLDRSGRPRIGAATITVPADSENIVESKSLKLYLDSLSGTRLESVAEVSALIGKDLSALVGSEVRVEIHGEPGPVMMGRMPGECIDDAGDANDHFGATGLVPAVLAVTEGPTVSEELYSELLRSLCPVTGQPDSATVLVRYQGPRIERLPLLRYLASYRRHSEFHEGCVERIFVDIQARCHPQSLTVYAGFNRRGGIDINPFRSNFEQDVPRLRLWRQ